MAVHGFRHGEAEVLGAFFDRQVVVVVHRHELVSVAIAKACGEPPSRSPAHNGGLRWILASWNLARRSRAIFSTISRSSCPGIGASAHDGAWPNNPIDTPCFRMVIWYPSIGKFSRGLMTDHLYPLGSSGSSPSYSWTTLDLLMPPPGAPYVTPPSPCARRGGRPPLVPWQVRCWWSSDFPFC
jgi:hypothetical protein